MKAFTVDTTLLFCIKIGKLENSEVALSSTRFGWLLRRQATLMIKFFS